MMHRNLDRRVEALVRIVRPEHLDELKGLLDQAMSDETSSWWLGSDGIWVRHDLSPTGELLSDMQSALTRQIAGRRRGVLR
jgi:polyphosphate kinase